jgi:hypothetical protein
VRIKLSMQRENAGDASDVVGELLGFVAGEGAVEEGLLAVAEPLFEDLVAAEGVVPDGFWNVFPVGGGVEMDIEETGAAGAGGGFAGAGHDGSGKAAVPQRAAMARSGGGVRTLLSAFFGAWVPLGTVRSPLLTVNLRCPGESA